MVSVESQRKQVIDELLTGPALGRSDQLRQLLRYMADAEAAGRGHELTEYSIGVGALGRPADYSPEIDSTVRSRVHELRRRLEEHYSRAQDTEWRIGIPKGTYRLEFTRIEGTAPAAGLPLALPVHPQGPAGNHRFALGMAAGSFLAIVLWLASSQWTPPAERAARRIWGSLLRNGEAISVVLATAPQLWVREFGDLPLPEEDPPIHFAPPDAETFREWFLRMTGQKPRRVILHPNNHSPLGGEANAAIVLAAFAAERGTRVELVLGENTGATEIRDRQAVVLGRAEYSRAAAALQPAKGYSVRYVPERRAVGVVLPDGTGYFRQEKGKTNYGLVTMLTRQTATGVKATMLVAGINSDGSEAAMSFMTTLAHLEKLEQDFVRSHGQVPLSYQVVVRSRSSDTRSLYAERAAVLRLD